MDIYNHTGGKIMSDEYDIYRGPKYIPTTEWVLPASFLKRYLKDTSAVLLISPEYADVPNRPNCVRIPLNLQWQADEQCFTFDGLSIPTCGRYNLSGLKSFGDSYEYLKNHARYLAALHNTSAREISELYRFIDQAPLETLVAWTVDLMVFQHDILNELARLPNINH